MTCKLIGCSLHAWISSLLLPSVPMQTACVCVAHYPEAVKQAAIVYCMLVGLALMCTSSPITDLLSMRAHLPMEEPQPMMLSATRAKFFTCTQKQPV